MIPDGCALAVHDGVVCVVGEHGDVCSERAEAGVYADDMQYLSEFEVAVTDQSEPEIGWDRLDRKAGPDGITTVLIGAASGEGRGDARRLLVKKDVAIDGDVMTIETTLRNYTPEKRVVDVELTAASNFRHIFECSSFFAARDPVDRDLSATDWKGGTRLSGTSPDGITRSATVQLAGTCDSTAETTADAARTRIARTLSIPPREETTVVAMARLRPRRDRVDLAFDPSVSMTSHPGLFDAATDTLRALMLPQGVPAAGAPRFVAPFGRDALLIGFQTLPFAPDLTRSVLTYFAGQQASTTDLKTLAEPGKIPHEGRRGDLPALGRSIRSPYYGTVDATPLFAALVAAYAEWVGEDALTDGLYDAALKAVEWTVTTGDEDGLVWYEPHDHKHGLTHQGWKDSDRAIVRPDGTAATPPIALAEVQGYAYRSLRGVSDLAATRGDDRLAERLTECSERLREAFNREFWLPEQKCYALALDTDGIVDAVASNQGHALWSGIVPPERADDAISRLLAPDMLTHTGLRTFSASHDAFDPLSYHRGSVWPHDTSIAAMGCTRYGRGDAAAVLVERGLDALATGATGDPDRWGFPELQVGLNDTHVDAGRAHHPDSCEPAAWSAGSAFGFAQATLGLDIESGVPAAEPTTGFGSGSGLGTTEATLHCRGRSYACRHSDDSTTVTLTCRASPARGAPDDDPDHPEVTTDG
ncbi:glycogen debranching N-terminal domain-containing protein [Halorubrum sp. AD140]|uniref:MGH1-like glycoside hydrolase domain-containing protein n=1 Tax=Halorubrum sp. AD140 TaxID=3050073 RepID=UPI002ACC4C65|nr:glycogen debranching N-terminal domain-containing protein [Halorubrum sp. AD140]MDZ5810731.1 glycogen debranching N-terminal domain-containing protein [Halorubrum sp. AD140]